ncbi:MAG TPA: TIM barrel protein [Verrucomicrobiae bacterium]|jgi:sugar phosphate isomerase/epimerase|nr:TIM barrel protein [Verrucomicrobiae bacterium]
MIVPREGGDLRWGFSTLGCPELSLPQVARLAAEFGVSEIEVRALERRTDFPRYAEEEKLSPEAANRLLKTFRGRIVVAGSDFKLIGASKLDRAMFLSFCDWAEKWNIPYVRVFGGGTFGKPLIEADYAEAAGNVNWWREEKRKQNWRTEILLETHDAFSSSPPCVRLSAGLDEPLGVIWDSHHTWRLANESPAQSWLMLCALVKHVHFKDSIDQPSERHAFTYVLPGAGQVPIAEIMALLRRENFQGAVSLEWEKMWHAYLPDLREALTYMRTQTWFGNQDRVAVSNAVVSQASAFPGLNSPTV